jgi:MarR family transcriptional regulator, 2-MHQ and catechol-resistance regulon repressor
MVMPYLTPAHRLWDALNQACRTVEGELDRLLAASGVTRTEFNVLEELLRHGPLPIGGLGGRVFLTSGSMTYLIDKLERKGWIRRRAGEEDRRVIYAELTDEGRALTTILLPRHEMLLEKMASDLTLEERRDFIELLERIHASAPTPPVHVPGD